MIHADGEHDDAARGMLVAALGPVSGHLIVDLSGCTYIDTATIGAILGRALELGNAGYRLELVAPPTGVLARTVERLGLPQLLPVLEASPTFHPLTLESVSPPTQEP